MSIDLDWNGIQINSEEKTITLNGKSYPFDQIRGARLVDVKKNCTGNEAGGTVEITTKDVKNPIYKFKSYTIMSKASDNYERICILLDLS